LEAFVRVGRSHPDVDDRDVRIKAFNQLQQLATVGGKPDDLEPALLQQPRQAGAILATSSFEAK